MGRLRLELDIDADVYPELHATLTSLVSDASRGERLRQLAAAGLVWEKLRIRGQAALHGVAPDAVAAAALAQAPAPVPAPRAARAASSRTPAAARSPAPAPVPVAPPRPSPPGFIDLALDAAPDPAPAEPPAPSTSMLPPPPVAQPWPPVLMDVVEPEAFATAIPIAKADDRPSRPMPLAPPVHQPPAPPSPVRVVEEVHDAAPPDPPVEHRSSTRSRLLRMKEKGLFKNG